MEKLIREVGKKGFVSLVIGKSVESKFSKKPFKYLWLCELQQWFREVHNIYVEILVTETGFFMFNISSFKNQKLGWEETLSEFKTYEDSLEAGLLEALKLIKDE